MRQRFFIAIIIFSLVLFAAFTASASIFGVRDSNKLQKQLGWVHDSDNHHNICNGYYKEWPIPYSGDLYGVPSRDDYDITADRTTWKIKGKTTLSGNVRVTRPDQQLLADKAILYPNKKTGKVENVKVVGNVHLAEPGKLVVADIGWLHLPGRQVTLHRCIYRVAMNKPKTVVVKDKKTGKTKESHLYQMTARGSAKLVKQIKKGILDLYKATYTTCSPVDSTWLIKANKLHLNSNSGRGEAYNSVLTVKNIPVFYLPYINFPIDNRRYTGFLYPTIGSDLDSGYIFAAPFYLNLAPNYDATITPTNMTKRGLMISGVGRYLTNYDQGQLQASLLPNDRVFKKFQKSANTDFPGHAGLNRLINASDSRRTFSWQDQFDTNDHWSGKADYNYMSDDYYLQDFGSSLVDGSTDQLLRQGRLNYQNEYWDFLGNFQYYQTIHPVNRGTIGNQAARLPQFVLSNNYSNLPFGLVATMSAEYDNFLTNAMPGATSSPMEGHRVSFSPILRLPLSWPFAYITPEAQLQMVKYHTRHSPVRNAKDRGMAIPTFDIDAGVNFERDFSVFHQDLRQTLEPQIYYLYVPYRDQDGMPIFDTSAESFSYDMMFQPNRFSGVDRTGDADQLTTAVTTRFIDADTGEEKASASVGQIHYFRERKVALCSGTSCSIPTIDRLPTSPVIGTASYHFDPDWTATVDAAYSTHVNSLTNESLTVNYKPDDYHILNFEYQWLKGDEQFPGLISNSNTNDLKQTNVSGFWRLNDHWSIMGRWNYNWTYDRVQSFYYGIAYESCCWAVRFVQGRAYLGSNGSDRENYRHAFYIQFALKGFGRIGEGGNPDSTLANAISGYTDTFGKDN